MPGQDRFLGLLCPLRRVVCCCLRPIPTVKTLGLKKMSFPMLQMAVYKMPPRHHRQQAGGQLATCTICSKAFPSASHLRRHMQTHTGVKPYSCGLCGKLYRHRFHLYAHRREVHGVQPYQCSTCDHSFADVSALRFHESSHSAGGKS